MIGGIKAVERSLAELVEIEVMPLLRIVVSGEHEYPGAWLRSDNVINDPAQLAELVHIVPSGQLVHMAMMIIPEHSSPSDTHTGRIRNNGLLEADLRSVSEARHHVGVLAPLLREGLLGRWGAVRVLEAFDVATYKRLQSDALHKPEQV